MIKKHYTKVAWPDANHYNITIKQLSSSLQQHITEANTLDREELVELMRADKRFYSKQAELLKNSERKVQKNNSELKTQSQKSKEAFENRFGPEIRAIELELKSTKEPLNPSQVGRVMRLNERLAEIERKRLEVKNQSEDQEYENFTFEEALRMAELFSGVFYHLMKKAWDESRSFLMGKEAKHFEKIEGLQRSSAPDTKQEIQTIVSELSANRLELFELLTSYKLEAEVKAMGIMTSSRERGSLTREGEILLRRCFLPALDIRLSDYFRDLCDWTDSEGIGAIMMMEGGGDFSSFEQAY